MMTNVNSAKVRNTKTMHEIIQISSFVQYDIGGVIEVRDPNIDAKVNNVVIPIVTRPKNQIQKLGI